jgi:hypothetical protein
VNRLQTIQGRSETKEEEAAKAETTTKISNGQQIENQSQFMID